MILGTRRLNRIVIHINHIIVNVLPNSSSDLLAHPFILYSYVIPHHSDYTSRVYV